MGVIDILSQLIFPRFCVGCGAFGSYICQRCGRDILWAQPIESPLPFKRVLSLSSYEGVVRTSITMGKYAGYSHVLEALCKALDWKQAQGLLQGSPTVVPIPLHPRRRRERGFNQAEIIARHFCQLTKLHFDTQLLKRIRYTTPQASLHRKDRLHNLQGAFSIEPRSSYPHEILLVDDVWTTGSTMQEAARTLRSAGIDTIFGLTLAQKM